MKRPGRRVWPWVAFGGLFLAGLGAVGWLAILTGRADQRLLEAIATLDPEGVHRALGWGADVNRRGTVRRADGVTHEEVTPLVLAVIRGRPDFVEILLDAGADVNATDGVDSTPLDQAVVNDEVAIVRVLIDAGADVESGGSGGRSGTTPTCLAARHGNAEILTMLADAGADVNVSSQRSVSTPLSLAIESGSLSAVRALVDAGAVLLPGGPAGEVARLFGEAIARRDFEMARTIVEAGLDVESAAVTGRFLFEKLLVEHRDAWLTFLQRLDRDGGYGDVLGMTWLMKFLRRDLSVGRRLGEDARLRMASRLIALGADVNARDASGMTAIMHAADAGSPAMVDLLLTAGARTDVVDENGLDVFEYLENGRNAGDAAAKSAIRQLIETRPRVAPPAPAPPALPRPPG